MKTETTLWLALAVAILGFSIWLQRRYQDQVDSLNSIIREQEAIITYLKTESGKTVSTKPAAEITKEDLEHFEHRIQF